MIPIYIPTFNNPTYTKKFVHRLLELGQQNIQIIDNNSTYPKMYSLLDELEGKVKVIRLEKNRGPHFALRDVDFYKNLPNFFCLSDPDIEISTNIPENFIDILQDVSEIYRFGKVGFAHEIPEESELRNSKINIDGQIWSTREWEKQFWENKVGMTPGGDDIFSTTLDTQFALYNKKYFDPNERYKSLRIAGRFTAKHLGLYKSTSRPSDEVEYYEKSTRYSYFAGNLNAEINPVFEILVHEYTKMVEEIDSLRRNNQILGQKNLELDKKIQNFYNSKSWKLISLFKRILGK
jgi:hypothetical protein